MPRTKVASIADRVIDVQSTNVISDLQMSRVSGRNHSFQSNECESAQTILADRGECGAGHLAEAVPESAVILRNGMAGCGDAGTRCSELAGAQRPGTK